MNQRGAGTKTTVAALESSMKQPKADGAKDKGEEPLQP